MELLETYKDQIQRLCKLHKVKALYAFGSVNTAKFTADSDVDLLVDFDTNDLIEYTDNYFDLKLELERILNRSIFNAEFR